MVEIDLPDKTVDLIGEDVFAAALDFAAVTGNAEGCLTNRLGLTRI
jgi:hypothetical protein